MNYNCFHSLASKVRHFQNAFKATGSPPAEDLNWVAFLLLEKKFLFRNGTQE